MSFILNYLTQFNCSLVLVLVFLVKISLLKYLVMYILLWGHESRHSSSSMEQNLYSLIVRINIQHYIITQSNQRKMDCPSSSLSLWCYWIYIHHVNKSYVHVILHIRLRKQSQNCLAHESHLYITHLQLAKWLIDFHYVQCYQNCKTNTHYSLPIKKEGVYWLPMYAMEFPTRTGFNLLTSFLPNSSNIIRMLRKYSRQRCSFSIKWYLMETLLPLWLSLTNNTLFSSHPAQ